ncbi:MAG: hypothetical protein V2I57_08690 [Xanthomonadales bacterium]|jgi:hypothetical protein|nr:hypothetical protein [Xanthomonadales bacterium]
MSWSKTLLALALAAAGSLAQAAVLSTSTLSESDLGKGRESACEARNPGESPLEVSIEGFDAQGRRVVALTFDLLPGSTRRVLAPENTGSSARIASCQFSFSGRASKLEARIIVSSPDRERELVSRLAR